MLARPFWIMLLVVMASLLAVAGCGPGASTESSADVTSSEPVTSDTVTPATATPEVETSEVATGTTQVVSNQGVTSTEEIVESSAPSETNAGGASVEPQSEAGAEDEAEGSEQPVGMAEYVDSTYHFGVSYPSDFVLSNLSAEKLAQLMPTPEASFIFMNPVTAASDIVETEPADLEIRVYSAEGVDSLESWLTANGLLPEDGSVQPEAFQTDAVSGLRVCASTMIVPGCSNFVFANGYVYQLIPITLAGEEMVKSFRFEP